MSPDKARSEEWIFERAADIPSASQRAAFLDEACQGDAPLRARLEELLAAHFGARGFLPESNTRLPPFDDDFIPSLPGLRPLRRVGEGGFGEVWLAEQQEPVRRLVAVKLLKLGMDTRQVIARFEAERQALALMDHPNIARIFDAGATGDGRPYFVMEFVDGTRITDYADEHQLSIRERLRLFVLVCQAIQHAHQKGIIHRDIKPSNALIACRDGIAVPKIIDFGIAKAIDQQLTDKTVLTHFQQFLGTPAYISPEQALVTSSDIDTRSDIYSLGVLLYELLTGTPPFSNAELLSSGLDEMRRVIREKNPTRPSNRVLSEMRRARHEEPDAPGAGGNSPQPYRRTLQAIDPDLDWIVMKCLEKDRGRRYETANGVAMDVLRHLNNEPVTARPPSTAYRISKLVQRNPVVSALGALLIFAVVTAMVLGAAMNLRIARANMEVERVNRRLSETVRSLEAERMEERAAEGRRSQPMAWLARQLRENPNDRVAAARLFSMFNHRSFALPVFVPFQHGAKVHTACFSPDGTEIMTAAEDGTVHFWDAATGQSLRVLSNRVSVASAAYCAGGSRLIVTTHDGVANIHDARDHTLLQKVSEVRDPSSGCIVGRDGRWLYVEHKDAISRWDLQTGTRLEPTLNLPGEIEATRYSQEAACLAVLCKGGGVHVLNETTGEPLAPPLHLADASGLEFTPDGRRLFITSWTKHILRIWEYQDTGPLLEFAPSPPTPMETLQFTRDGKRLLSWTWDLPPRLWDLETRAMVGSPIPTGIHPFIALSHDGRLAASGSQDGITLLIDTATAGVLLEPIEHDGSVHAVSFSSDGTRLITGSVDGTARVWDLRMQSPEPPRLPPSTGGGTALFDRTGAQIMISVERNGIQVCDTETAQPVSPILRHPRDDAHIRYAWFTPDDSRILTVGEEGLLRLWDTATWQPVIDMPVGHQVLKARISPDARYVVAGGSRHGAGIWSTETGQRLATTDHNDNEIVTIDLHPEAPRFITGSADGLARIWSLPNGQRVAPPLKHRGVIWSASFSPDGKRIVTASADTTAQLWDARTSQPIHAPLRHTRGVLLAEFSPQGDRVLTGSEDGTARVWNATTGEAITPLLRHGARIWVGAFSPEGRMVVTGSDDDTIRFWDAASGLPMSEPLRHDSNVGRIGFSPDGRRLFSFGGRARVWNIIDPPLPVPPWICDLAECLAGRRFTSDGQSHPVSDDIVGQLRRRFQKNDNGRADFYARWAHWFLVERMSDSPRPFAVK